MDVHSPDGELRPYQVTGVTWITQRLKEPDTRAVLLCDDPGLGKTVQALAVWNAIAAAR